MTRRITSPVLVGRTDELHQLEQGLERAGAGGSSTFLVAGEAGIGKSRLVDEFRRRARRSGARVLTGGCMDAGEGALDNAALIQVLGQAAAVAPRSVIARMPEAKRAELAMLVPDLDPHVTASRPRSGDQARLFEAALGLLTGLARDAPVVLVIEDLHWSDRSTREFLTFAVRRMQDVGIVVVATYRDDELVPDHPLRPLLGQLERQPEVERLDLARLGAGDVQRLVEIIVDEQSAVELLAEVIAQSDGNPFFVEELLAADRRPGELPRHLADLLLLRVDATSPGTRLVVRAAAVGGHRVDDQLLEAVVGVEPDALTEFLRGAVAQHILVPSGRGYAFRHALVREAVEEALLPGERQRLHVAWAEAHERDAMEHPTARNAAARAYHWSAADRPTRALPASYEAALEAESVRAYAAAAEHYERTLALWEREAPATAHIPVERVDVAERGADAAHAAGDHERALALARQARAYLDPRADAVRDGLLHARIGIELKAIGLAGAPEAFEQALRSIPVDPPSRERASVLGDFTQTLMLAGDDRAEVVGAEALEVARAVGALGTEAQVLSVLGTISSSRGDPEGSVERLRESVRIAEEIGDPEHRCRAYLNLSHVQWLAGELADSLATAEQGLGIAIESGLDGSWGPWLRGNAAEAHFLLGNHEAALAVLNAAAPLGPTNISGTLNVIVRARVAVLAGRLDEAQQLLGSVAEPAGDDANLLLFYFEAHAELAMWQRRPDVAQDVFERAAEVFHATETAWLLLPVLAAAAAAVADAAVAGSDDPTGAFADHVASRLDVEGVLPPIQRPWARIAHAELARLRASPDPELWQEAVEGWDALSIPHRAAYCRFRRAEALLVTDGPRRQATELLRAAHRTSSALGAQPLREEVEALARRARIDLEPRPGSEQGAGVPALPERLGLTPREWEVLQHVAHGTRNAQIATTLFISEKTVERHVTSILSKLGATNRVEAAGILHRLSTAEQGRA